MMAIRVLQSAFVVTALIISLSSFTSSYSISAVSVTKKESLKGISKISLPQVPIPEFPKFVSTRPKNPSLTSNQQQQNHQQPLSYQSHSQNTQVHNVSPSLPIHLPASILQDHEEFTSNDEIMITETEHDFHDGFPQSENFSGSSSIASSPVTQEKAQQEPPIFHLPSLPIPALLEAANHPLPPLLGFPASVASNSNSAKNEPAKSLNPSGNGEKYQESGEFPMPMHVMNILNALGSGGSLAQATKPEKDGGHGSGFTTANAMGYATGDNATVTASVSNKMEVQTTTVILTESATASASSLSNGTAFSQATLSSNGWSQFGSGNGWPSGPGSGWAKASNPIIKRRMNEIEVVLK